MATAKQLAWRKKFAAMARAGTLKKGTRKKATKKKTARKNPTSSRSEVRSPTRTSSSTKADTRGNITVTGGAGRGATTRVTVRRNPNVKLYKGPMKPAVGFHVVETVDDGAGGFRQKTVVANVAKLDMAKKIAQLLANETGKPFGVIVPSPQFKK